MSYNIVRFYRRGRVVSSSDRQLAEWVQRFRRARPFSRAQWEVVCEAKAAGRGSRLQAALSRGDAEVVSLSAKRIAK